MKYTALVPDVLAHLTADPSDPVTEGAVRNAVIEFCARSRIWRAYADGIDVVAGEGSYDIELPSGADLACVLSATLDGMPLDLESPDRLDAAAPTWRTDTGAGRRLTQTDMASVLVTPVPAAAIATGLVLSYALMPKRSASVFPDWIAAQHWEGLTAGAMYRLMLMRGRPWSDEKTGIEKRQQFNTAISSAKESATRGLSRAPTRTTSQH